MWGLAFYSPRTVGVVRNSLSESRQYDQNSHVQKNSSTPKLLIPPSLPVYPDICQSGAVWRGLQDKILLLKISPLNIAVRVVSSPLDHAGCNSTVCPAQETDSLELPCSPGRTGNGHSFPLLCLLKGETFALLLFLELNCFCYLSFKRGITEPEFQKLPSSAWHLLMQFCPIPKRMHLREDFY